MARRNSKSKSDASEAPGAARYQRESVAVLLIALGLLTLSSLLAITQGAWIDWWAQGLQRAFGWGDFLVALALVAAGILLFKPLLWEEFSRRWETIAGFELLFLCVLGLFHLFLGKQDPLLAADNGMGGGYVGWAITRLLRSSVGTVGAWLVLLLGLAGGAVLGFRLSRDSISRGLGAIRQGVQNLRERASRQESQGPIINAPPAQRTRVRRPRPAEAKPKPVPKSAEPLEAEAVPRRRMATKRLPPLDILDPGSPQKFSESDARVRAAVIEETLAAFGVPAKVAEINIGPVVTQFGVQPGYLEAKGANGTTRRRKVRVSKIYNLANDLALALAAAPIRIEAPVPGRPVVGIEVPNSEISLVSLRSVLESPTYRKRRARLKIALGHDVSGKPVVADLAVMPHLLIAGATGSGKSVCINSLVSSLIFNNEPDQLRLVMIDPKMVELPRYNGLPHLIAPVVVELEPAVAALRWVTFQMDERYRKFSAEKARHLDDYNRKMEARGEEPLPRIIVVIDELADLMMTSPDEVERHICRIAQMARATGIHLVIATQRPSVDVVTGLIKANFPARISFAVTSQIDSRVILDSGGAEKLLGRGDMLFMPPDSSRLIRLQGCFVSDAEVENLVKFWTEILPMESTPRLAPWASLEEADKEDALLDEAIALVRETGSASASLLQRRMRIGYPRAARLIDAMEERGIIGPPETGGRPREVLTDQFTEFAETGDAHTESEIEDFLAEN
jgi:S-DNA-T family DNA segregation ATPase FtsK/SpoIIIE